MAPHNGILTPAQVATLRAVPTGHEPHTQGTALDIAQALDITPAQAANALGALRRAGLVARDAQGNGAGVATWARFDSIAPGLEAWQRLALKGAERAAPCRYQAEALESFGPECEAAPHGLALRSDLKAETRDALDARNVQGCIDAARDALDSGRLLRAALLYREAARFCAGSGRRARYESTAQDLEAQAEAEAQERGAFGMGTAIPPVDAPAPAQDLEARRARDLEAQAETFADMPPADSPVWNENRPAQDLGAANCHCLECDSGFDMGPHDLQICPRCYPEGRAQAEAAQVLAPLAQANANRKRAESAQDWTARAEAEAAQVAALPQVLAFLDARPVAHGLKVAPRPYVCRVCGNVESFSTNHTGPHYSACGACSWRGGRDDSGVWYSAQDKGRPHVYNGPNPTGQGETNPHALGAARSVYNAATHAAQVLASKGGPEYERAEANAQAAARVLEAAQAEAEDLEGKAAQAQHNARVWARPGVPQETGDKAAQDAAQAEAEARDARTVANVLEALKAQAEAAPPRLALPSPYVLEAFARLDAETGLALVYLPQNVATPWASYRVALATGVCVAGDYLAPYDNARALALRAFSERLGDALAPVNC